MTEPAAIPAGVIPLSWAESTDERRNSRFEALSHLCAEDDDSATDEPYGGYWVVAPVLEENAVAWRAEWDGTEQTNGDYALSQLRFATPSEAQAACEQREIELGGAAHAPRVPQEDPDQTPPLVTDDHGFAPTRTIRSRWSRNQGVLYLYRVWAKPESPEQTVEKKLEGAEYEAALPAYITQQMVQGLVANITQPGGWCVPLTWNVRALGDVRMDVDVHFVGVRRLRWRKFEAEWADATDLPAPSHALINSIVGEHLARKKAEFEAQLAGTTDDELRRQIAKNARKLGIDSPLPEPEQESGFVLPATLEDMAAAGVDLRGASLR